MSDERRETIDLAYVGRALQRLTNEVASLSEQMTVLTAIVLRHERMLDGILQEMRDIRQQITAMVAQNARVVDRLRTVEERGDTFEDRLRETDEKMRALDERLDALEEKPRG